MTLTAPARRVVSRDPRTQFGRTVTEVLDEDLSAVLVYAEISGRFFGEAARRHPDRVVNVGIREQLLVNVGAGFALTGMRPVVHTFGTFLVERAFEQIKLGFGHQGVGGVLVGGGGSFDASDAGRTHQAPGDVALLDTLPDIVIHAPGSAEETDAVLRRAIAADGLHYVRIVGQTNAESFHGPGLHVVRRGAGATVIALGPVLDEVLAATTDRDVQVLYAHSVRPFDTTTFRGVLTTPDVVLVEPWLAGTSSRVVSDALRDVPHRLLSLGTRRMELRHYGTPAEHQRAHGLDAAGIRRSLDSFLDGDTAAPRSRR
jgi:transketolase